VAAAVLLVVERRVLFGVVVAAIILSPSFSVLLAKTEATYI